MIYVFGIVTNKKIRLNQPDLRDTRTTNLHPAFTPAHRHHHTHHRNRKSDDQRVRIIGCNAVFHAGKIRVCYRIDVVNIVIFREMVLSREKYFTMPLFSLKMRYL